MEFTSIWLCPPECKLPRAKGVRVKAHQEEPECPWPQAWPRWRRTGRCRLTRSPPAPGEGLVDAQVGGICVCLCRLKIAHSPGQRGLVDCALSVHTVYARVVRGGRSRLGVALLGHREKPVPHQVDQKHLQGWFTDYKSSPQNFDNGCKVG